MKHSRLGLISFLALLLLAFSLDAQEGTEKKKKKKAAEPAAPQVSGEPGKKPANPSLETQGEPKKEDAKKEEKKASANDKNKLPITKLAPAKLFPGLCLVQYRISTGSPECQAFFDQGLGYLYSYVWMEAARSFETAAQHDPNCPMAFWALSRAIEKWGKGQQGDALKKAQELLPRASHRESLLITARLHEKGMMPGTTPDKRKELARKSIDELLALYDDDEEGWVYRAQLAETGVQAASFYKALLRYNPLHAGAHHELVHFYENFKRPALGWPHAELYMKSSPGLPHAFHMQAHLAMRIGRWEKTTDWSARAIELERDYHQQMNVKPSEDWQYSHHLETLMKALTHDGRFKEARAIKALCESQKITHKMPWFDLHLAEGDFDAALSIANQPKNDKLAASYLRAMVYLKKGAIDRAVPEVEVLREAYQQKRTDKELETRLWETQGLLLAGQGSPAGLKLLVKLVNKTKDDYRHHAWGRGANYMETWGIAALQVNQLDQAEEAFLEALAHDAGSVRGALGMQVVCERQGRPEAAQRFHELAQRCWRKADPGILQALLEKLREHRTNAE